MVRIDAHADRDGPGAGAAVDHAPPAPGQARVDAEHPHDASCRRTELVFDAR